MTLSSRLDKPLRAQLNDSDLDGYSSESDEFSEPATEAHGGSDTDSRSDDEHGEQIGEEPPLTDDEDSLSDQDIQQQLNSIPFATLARAQESLHQSAGRKRKRNEETFKDHEEKLRALRARLQEIKNTKSENQSISVSSTALRLTQSGKIQKRHIDASKDEGDSASSADETGQKQSSRPSKHAPTVQSSKRPVSRNRTVVANSAPKPKPLDPRFSSLSGPAPDDSRVRQRYAFLNDYRRAEMGEIREVLADNKKAKGKQQKKRNQVDEETADRLKKELGRMENRERAEAEKERQAKVIRDWKRNEREKIREGKKPFYLKNSERKKLALVDRFDNMKGKEREKAMRKRKKRLGEKEKRSMPAARRMG